MVAIAEEVLGSALLRSVVSIVFPNSVASAGNSMGFDLALSALEVVKDH
jgi:hypothetical protein